MQRIRLPAVFALISEGVPSRDDLALIDHGNAVGECVGLLQIMGGEQNGFAARDHSANFIPQHAARFHVEPDRGLIEKEQVRIAADCQGEQHALPLASGKIAELAIAAVSPGQRRPGLRRRHGLLVIGGEQIDVLADAQSFRNSSHLQHGARCASGFQDSWGRRRKRAPFPNSAASIPAATSRRWFCPRHWDPAVLPLRRRAPGNRRRAAPGCFRSFCLRLRDWRRSDPSIAKSLLLELLQGCDHFCPFCASRRRSGIRCSVSRPVIASSPNDKRRTSAIHHAVERDKCHPCTVLSPDSAEFGRGQEAAIDCSEARTAENRDLPRSAVLLRIPNRHENPQHRGPAQSHE